MHAVTSSRGEPPIVENPLRVVDGNRSPFFTAIKRRVEIHRDPTCLRIELAELRHLVVPWLRIPYFVYWRRRSVRSHEHRRLEVAAATFLETGHVPATWWL